MTEEQIKKAKKVCQKRGWHIYFGVPECATCETDYEIWVIQENGK